MKQFRVEFTRKSEVFFYAADAADAERQMRNSSLLSRPDITVVGIYDQERFPKSDHPPKIKR